MYYFYFQEERKAKELKFKEMEEQIERDLSYQKNLEAQNEKFLKEKNDLALQLQKEREENEKFGKEKMDKLFITFSILFLLNGCRVGEYYWYDVGLLGNECIDE